MSGFFQVCHMLCVRPQESNLCFFSGMQPQSIFLLKEVREEYLEWSSQGLAECGKGVAACLPVLNV